MIDTFVKFQITDTHIYTIQLENMEHGNCFIVQVHVEPDGGICRPTLSWLVTGSGFSPSWKFSWASWLCTVSLPSLRLCLVLTFSYCSCTLAELDVLVLLFSCSSFKWMLHVMIEKVFFKSLFGTLWVKLFFWFTLSYLSRMIYAHTVTSVVLPKDKET